MIADAGRIARAVLYEGYALYPYRASALKNRKRHSIGGLLPRADAALRGALEPWRQRTACIMQGSERAELALRVAFLQPVRRQILRLDAPLAAGALLTPDVVLGARPVDQVEVGGRLLVSWDEAAEIVFDAEGSRIGDLASPRVFSVRAAAATEIERVAFTGDAGSGDGGDAGGAAGALVVRSREAIEAAVTVRAAVVAPGVYRLEVALANETPAPAGTDPAPRTMHAAHAVLALREAAFVSSLEPPAALQGVVDACECEGAWPVLAGTGETMLLSPVILYDHPQVAEESPTDFFDATENDAMLVLRILTLTAAERREMAALDPRARELLARVDALEPDAVRRLHGAVRGFSAVREGQVRVRVGETLVGPGDRVRLRPRGRADILDLALDGRAARVEGVTADVDGRSYVTVVVDDDPGRDLGSFERGVGHRFFLRLDEIEPLCGSGATEGR